MELILDGDMKEENYMTIDHIIPQSLGGSNELKNLQAMCKECNVKKMKIGLKR